MEKKLREYSSQSIRLLNTNVQQNFNNISNTLAAELTSFWLHIHCTTTWVFPMQ